MTCEILYFSNHTKHLLNIRSLMYSLQAVLRPFKPELCPKPIANKTLVCLQNIFLLSYLLQRYPISSIKGHLGPFLTIDNYNFWCNRLKLSSNWWKGSTIGFLSNSRYKIAQNVSLNRQIKTFLSGITFRLWSFSSFWSLELSKKLIINYLKI